MHIIINIWYKDGFITLLLHYSCYWLVVVKLIYRTGVLVGNHVEDRFG